jgi:hypothetical protein
MSTILKALRRLEEDSPTAPANTGNPLDAAPATDPHTTAELRDRILAEESVAQSIAAAAQYDSNHTRRIARIAAAATLLTIGLGVGAYVMATRTSPDPTANQSAATLASPPVSAPEVDDIRRGGGRAGILAPQAKTDRAVVSQKPAEEVASGTLAASQPTMVPVPIPVATRSPRTATEGSGVSRSRANESPARAAGATAVAPPRPTPTPTPTPADEEMALAAVTPTPATLSANSARAVARSEASSTATRAKPPTTRSRPKPRVIEKSPPSVSAPQPQSPTSPTSLTSLASPRSSASPRSAPKKQPVESRPAQEPQPPKESKASPDPSPIEHRNQRALPELTIIRTAWHPSADRRSAKIRLEDTDEILNLREGDAVGGLVIREISPSAVVFKAGDVEIRRRVGHEESGN